MACVRDPRHHLTQAMAHTTNKLGRTKSAMDIDSSASQDSSRGSQLLLPTRYQPLHVAPGLQLTPLPSFEDLGPNALPPVLPPDVEEEAMNFSQLTESQLCSSQIMDSDSDDEAVAATRESTPMPEEPPTQGLNRMESIVNLGPVVANDSLSVATEAKKQQLSDADARVQALEAFLERHLVLARETQQLHTQQLATLAASTELTRLGWQAIAQELGALKEEFRKVGSTYEHMNTGGSRRSAVPRVHVPRYPV
ncbi:hypothetical protein FKP32DRAFT_1602889 [Trametes sanguinea]|nr:hypothetical protein FKP32DRAFT_1602889 [Trametes sanguinea]